MRRPPPKQQPLTNLLLKAIKSCGRNPYRLAKEAGIKDNLIYQFLRGKRSLTLTSADRLIRALNIELSAKVKAPHE